MMLQIAFYLSCGATACYLWGRKIKGKAVSFNSITRVVDFKWLDELLKEKATNLLVVVSGKVASPTPFNCKNDNGPMGAVFEATLEMGFETKLEDDGGLLNNSFKCLFQVKDTPWYLEDSTGQVKVVGLELATGFLDTLKPQFDMSPSEIFHKIEKREQGTKLICRGSLDTGTSLTIVGEAARDEAGSLTIQKPNEHSFMVFIGESSFDEMVGKLKSNSEFYFFYSKIFGTIAVAIAVMKGMLQIAFYLSCGATACYLWGRRIKGLSLFPQPLGFRIKADSFNSITRVVDIKRLDDLLKEKATNLLVVVSGKVASAMPSNGNENGPLGGAVLVSSVEMGYETKLDDDGMISKTHSFFVKMKEAPWCLEDSTGLVKVVGAEFADGFVDAAMKPKLAISGDEIFDWLLNPQEGSTKVINRAALDTGTSLTVVGEAARDEAGNLTIQKPNEHSFMVFVGEGSFEKMVGNLKSNSEFYFFCSKIFGTIALSIAVMKGVAFIRRVLRERSENADSDNEETP
ncbi:hypothetical protein Bca101_052982 [Brassica carinata]